MDFIYDILLNFNETFYDFYEWDSKDKIIHMRKVPLFRVKKEQMLDLTYNKVRFLLDFLNKIYQKTEVFTLNRAKKLDYVSLFSDGKTVLAILFDSKGNSLMKSKLLLEEEEEVLELVSSLKVEDCSYEILEKEERKRKTRKELERENYMKKQLGFLENESMIQYLFYECYGESGESKEGMLEKLNQDIQDHKLEIIEKIEHFFKLTFHR